MTDRITEIQARCEAATPGPWETALDVGKKYYIAPPSYGIRDFCYLSGGFDREQDASFIAHAREDIPYLLAQLAEAQDEVGRAHNREDEAYAQLAESQRRERAAVEALEQHQKPMLVIQEKWNPSECPNCHESFVEFEPCDDGYYARASFDRCPYCGQRLEWYERGPQEAGKGEAE